MQSLTHRVSVCPHSVKDTTLASKQEKKKKEREKRVAQKKVADARRLAQELAAKETQTSAKVNKVFGASLTGVLENAPPKPTESTTLLPKPR